MIKYIFIFLMLFQMQAKADDNLFKIMTYNIRYNAEKDYESGDGWDGRKARLVQFLKYHDAEIIGLQEVTSGQLQYLETELSEYKFIGVGRDDGKSGGEHTPIFWKKGKYELLEGNTFWLSETPDMPSKSWDAALNRIVTWAKFKRTDSGEEFYIFNTHFDHKGEIARLNSAELVTRKVNEIAGSTPAVIMGDFNIHPDWEPYEVLTREFKEAYTVSETPPYGPEGTSSGFEVCSDKALFRIDMMFIHGDIKILNYANLTDSYNKKYLSDHLPVISEILIGK